MQIYWTLKSIPELSGLPSGERGRVWRTAYWKIIRHWQYWASLLGIGLCVKIGAMLIGNLGAYIGGVVCALIHVQVVVHLARPYIRAALLHQNA